ncbi:uncharacterized protein B0I36DRAFT_369539 [Microdochium trichocladiopsis]|uniref:Ankyrin repeat-containing domain protein n=1 Tax=Microdochium trichocladiopsis TaxID=1682393 RepID=A0A9P8XU38_9PEZI|nr:uncharacterized protein B0I36DRAFT_369539 [Microdochium trichocladiopsis]KAH7014601.1 hypothetical protein B0I36DRAFT_369539 [Microdochium trichocladiopsis]
MSMRTSTEQEMGVPSDMASPSDQGPRLSLEALPSELVIMISDQLPLLARPSLAAVNRRFHAVLHPVIAGQALATFPYLLIWAASQGFVGLVQTLLDGGADPNAVFTTKHSGDPNTQCLHHFWWPAPHPQYGPPPHAAFQGPIYSPLCTVLHHRQWLRAARDQTIQVRRRAREPPEPHFLVQPRGLHRGSLPPRRPWVSSGVLTCLPRSAAVDPFDFLSAMAQTTWWSALHLAVACRHEDVVRLLVRHGARIDASYRGLCRCIPGADPSPDPPTVTDRVSWLLGGCWTALHLALCLQHEDMALLLLSLGAATAVSLTVPNHTALDSAVVTNSRKVLRELLLVESPKDDGLRLARGGLGVLSLSVTQSTSIETTRLLLSRGFSATALEQDGRTALHVACVYRQHDSAKELIRAGADVNAVWTVPTIRARPVPQQSFKPLDIVCLDAPAYNFASSPVFGRGSLAAGEEPQTDPVGLAADLIGHGANVHPELPCEHSPMVLAASACMPELLRLLAESGARVNDVDASGFTPLLGVAKPLALLGPGRPPHRLLTVRWLLDHGADPNYQEPSTGHTALWKVCQSPFITSRDTLDVARALLDAGADPNLVATSGESAFSMALEERNVELCRLLVSRGADVSAPTINYRRLFRDLLATMRNHKLHRGRDRSNSRHNRIEFGVQGRIQECLSFANLLFDIDRNKTILNDPHLFWRSAKYPAHRVALAFLAKGEPNLRYCPPRDALRTCLHNVLDAQSSRIVYDYELELVQELIKRGVDVNQGHPILQGFARFKWTAVRLLFSAGARIPLGRSRQALRFLISLSYTMPIGDILRLVLADLHRSFLDLPRAQHRPPTGAGPLRDEEPVSLDDPPENTSVWQRLLDRTLLRACKAPQVQAIAALLDAGANVNAGGHTSTSLSDDNVTPLSTLIKSAHKRERDSQRYQSLEVVADQFFDTFKLLCARGAALVMPPPDQGHSSSRKPPREIVPYIPHWAGPRPKPDRSLVTTVTEGWPSSAFCAAVVDRCDFVLGDKSEDDSTSIKVIFRDFVPDEVLNIWRQSARRHRRESSSSGSSSGSNDHDDGSDDNEEEEDEEEGVGADGVDSQDEEETRQAGQDSPSADDDGDGWAATDSEHSWHSMSHFDTSGSSSRSSSASRASGSGSDSEIV